MKVGLFLGYGPDVVLGKEGLGRYLGNLIRNLQASGNCVAIACPKWTMESLADLCGEFELDMNTIEFVIANRIPVIWKFYSRKNKKKKTQRSLFLKTFKFSIDTIADILLEITNFFLFFIFILLGAAAVLLLLPLFLLALFIYGIFRLAVCIKKQNKLTVKAIGSHFLKLYESVSENGVQLYEHLYNTLLEKIQKQLVDKINRNKPGVDVWYSPAIFWPVFNKIDGPKVINVPDLVTEEFATKWGNDKEILYSSKNCEKTIEEGKFYITYSDYIKESLLIKKFDKKKDNIFVIPHSINDLGPYVTIKDTKGSPAGKSGVFTEQYCKNLIESAKFNIRDLNTYIYGYNFDDVNYLFYPSQARPHKNLLNLIKAYEKLLRRKYVRIKLFLTCDFNTLPEVKDYIIRNRLQYDILSFYNITTKQLAALYHQACLVVNPTLYEGGFPFTFGEGMSVGVPSVMSRIPQVCEFTDLYDLDDILFDPYDVEDITNTILYGIENRTCILEKEKKLYDWMKKAFENKKTGDLYVQAFSYAYENN